jgi:hypothetical protein
MPIALTLILLVAQLPVLGANAPLGKVVPRLGNTHVNGTALTLETTLFSGDSVATEPQSLAVVQLPLGDQVHVGPASSVVLNGSDQQVIVGLEQGTTIIRSGQGQTIPVNALGLFVQPVGPAAYTVTIQEGDVYVQPDEGSVEVRGTNKSVVVPAGKAMKFELAAATAPGPVGAGASSLTPGQGAAIALAVSLGVTLGIVWPVLANDIDDAEDLAREEARQACIDAITAVSPSAPTTGCG